MAETRRTVPVDHAHEHPEGHEHSDVNVRWLLIALAVIFVIAVIVHVGLYWLLGAYSRQEAGLQVNQPRTAVAPGEPGPPRGVPRLQGIPGFHPQMPRQDMLELRARNAAVLDGYGPTGAPGFVRIPLERAMDLALEQGMFPVREPAGDPATNEEGGDDAEP